MKNAICTNARDDLRPADFLTMDTENADKLIRASVGDAINRRERDTARNAAEMRIKYFDDAVSETWARMLERLSNDDYMTACVIFQDVETPRADLPLAYFAACAAGSALDAVIYQDGGHAVKLTAKEARENYGDAKGEEDTRRAVIAPRQMYREPATPGPESALIASEILPRILSRISGNAVRKAAARLLALLYAGESMTDAAAAMGVSEQYTRRIMQAICNAAAELKVIDGETAELERLIAWGERATASVNDRRARAAAVAALKARAAAPDDKTPAPATAALLRDVAKRTRPARLQATAQLSRTDYESIKATASAFYHAAAK